MPEIKRVFYELPMTIRAPLEVRKSESGGLQITWPDGLVQNLSAGDIRRQCPCATCREERGQATTARSSLQIIDSSIDEQTRLVQIRPVGGYAISLRWGDGHDTGIYSFEFLRKLSPR